MSKEPILSVDFSDENGGNIVFYSIKDLAEWLEDEKLFWNWLNKWNQVGDQQTRNSTHNFINLNQQCFNGTAINGNNADQNKINNIAQYLRSYAANNGFHSASRKAQNINTILNRHSFSEAFSALAFTIGGRFDANFAPSFSGAIELKLIQSGFDNSSHIDLVSAMEKSRRSAVAKFSNTNKENTELLEKQNTQLNKSLRGYDIASKWYNSRWNFLRAKSEAQVKAKIEELEGVKKTYSEYMKLKSPVKYWSSKAEDHETNASSYKSILKWYFPIALFLNLLFVLGASLLTEWLGETFYFAGITMVVLVITTSLWLGKILVRLFLSEHHLFIDSNERAIMAQTYLALVNEGSVDKGDREAVLNALFRPTADGIVKDDAAPMLSPSSILSNKLMS